MINKRYLERKWCPCILPLVKPEATGSYASAENGQELTPVLKNPFWLLFFFFNWKIVALECCVVSAVQQSESARSMHIFHPSWASLPSPISLLQVVTAHQAKLPVLCSSFPLATHFIHTMLLSQFIPPSPSPAVSTSPFSTSALLSLYRCPANGWKGKWREENGSP